MEFPKSNADDILCSGFLDKVNPLDSMASSLVFAAGKALRTTNRYFVLRASNPFLEYFASTDVRAGKKGAIDLARCKSVNADAQIPGKATRPFTFSLEMDEQVVYLNAGTKENMDMWIEKITAHMSHMARANNQGYTVRVEIHEVTGMAKPVSPGQVVFVVDCSGNKIKSPLRAFDSVVWDDAIFDFHAPLLPARLTLTLCEKQNLFGTNFGGLKLLGELSLQLTDKNASAVHDAIPIKSSAGVVVGTVGLSWDVYHNAPLVALSQMQFTTQSPTPVVTSEDSNTATSSSSSTVIQATTPTTTTQPETDVTGTDVTGTEETTKPISTETTAAEATTDSTTAAEATTTETTTETPPTTTAETTTTETTTTETVPAASSHDSSTPVAESAQTASPDATTTTTTDADTTAAASATTTTDTTSTTSSLHAIPGKAPFTVFCGTWNLGNSRPAAMNQKNGLGWLDAAFGADIVAIGAQESSFASELFRDALKDNADTATSPAVWSALDIIMKLREPAPAGIPHKLMLVNKKKRKCFSLKEACQWLVRNNIVTSEPRAIAIIKGFASKELLVQVSEQLCMWNLDDGSRATQSWMEALAGNRRQDLDEYSSELNLSLDTILQRERRDNWVSVLSSIMDESFLLLTSATLLEMSLAVYVNRRHAGKAVSVETASEATGLAGFMPNKGGICMRVVFGGVSIAFISAHLAAHDEREYVLARNSNYRNILRGARTGIKELEVTMQTDHVIFMGDLNYRLDLNLLDERGGPGMAHEQHWRQISERIEQQDWKGLMDADQLKSEQKYKRAFYQFKEGEITFPPTFKVIKGQEEGYAAKRLPSYCDRVLFTSLPDRENSIKLLQYQSAAAVTSSDHKPVFALFSVESPRFPTISVTTKEARAYMIVADRSDPPFSPLLLFNQLCFQGLNDQKDVKRRLFINVYGPEVFDDPRASVKSIRINVAGSTLTARHIWTEENIPPIVCKPVPHSQYLATRHVVVSVYEQALGVGKASMGYVECLGAVVLALRVPTLSRQPFRFQVELMKNGIPAGVLSGALSVHRNILDLDSLDEDFMPQFAGVGTVPSVQDPATNDRGTLDDDLNTDTMTSPITTPHRGSSGHIGDVVGGDAGVGVGGASPIGGGAVLDASTSLPKIAHLSSPHPHSRSTDDGGSEDEMASGAALVEEHVEANDVVAGESHD